MDPRSKFLGAMIGSALGDAIGELALENNFAVGGLDPRHLGDTFRANFQEEPWRGYALGPPAIFRRVERESISHEAAAQSAEPT